MSYFRGLIFFFALGCWGFAPSRRRRNGNPSSGAPGRWMKQKEAKQRGKTGRKKGLPGLFLFENRLYLKCKITSEFLIHFSPGFFWLLLSLLAVVGFLGLQFLFPCLTLILFLWSCKSFEKLRCGQTANATGLLWLDAPEETGAPCVSSISGPFLDGGNPFVLSSPPFPSPQ